MSNYMKDSLVNWSKRIAFDGHTYEFDDICIIVDGSKSVYYKSDVLQMFDDVVRKFDLHHMPSPDPLYWNIHVNNANIKKSVIIRHIYKLIYEHTDEYLANKKFKEQFNSAPRTFSFVVKVNGEQTSSLTFDCFNRLILSVSEELRKYKNYDQLLEFHIVETTCF